MSLRGRLLLVLGVVAVVALAVADVATYSSLKSFLLGQLDENLQSAHVAIEQQLVGEADNGPPGPGGNGPGGGGSPCQTTGGTDVQPLPQANGAYVEVRCPDGQNVVLNYAYPGETKEWPKLPATLAGFSKAANPGGEPTVYFDAAPGRAGGPQFRVRAGVLSNGDQLVLALPLTSTTDTLHRLLLVELAVSGIALVLVGVAGWWLVRLGLRPLRDIEKTAGAIATGELGHRVPGDNPNTEVGRLARTLNVMLGRIEDAFATRDATEAELRRSEARMRQFVADASHELRTPLAAVSAYAELFDRGAGRHAEDLGRVMSGIRGETGRMGRLVEDLLLLAKVDEGLPVERKPVELVAVAAEAVEAALAVGPQWPAHLEASEPVEVLGDRERLRQVVDNLLSNVRAHTPPGTPVAVRVRREDTAAVIEVADQGPGLDKENTGRVFERFFRADPSRARASGGTGLGLSIVAALVEAHGGTVDASNAPDGGAVFTIRLPDDLAPATEP